MILLVFNGCSNCNGWWGWNVKLWNWRDSCNSLLLIYFAFSWKHSLWCHRGAAQRNLPGGWPCCIFQVRMVRSDFWPYSVKNPYSCTVSDAQLCSFCISGWILATVAQKTCLSNLHAGKPIGSSIMLVLSHERVLRCLNTWFPCLD